MGDPLQAALQENAQLKRQLAAVTDELESFTYSVSHDLRASLRHINAFVEIVNEDWTAAGIGDVNPELHSGISSHLATITGAARLMAQMIDALMELSRLGRVELNLSRVDVRPLLDEVCEALELEAQAGSGQAQACPIQWRIAHDFPPLHADPVLVRQLLQHLISNAIKFSRPAAGRPAAEIEIGWRWLAGDVGSGEPGHEAPWELFVKDNGAGFNPRFGGKLFGVFQRLHSASEFQGIGMGLALSRKIVQRHGGSVAAASPAPLTGLFASHPAPLPQLAGGCEVRFTLPGVTTH
jgi:light-regulated signal transduction histidine kinase (bacteriophytochrome)